jgi:hypothetical protein
VVARPTMRHLAAFLSGALLLLALVLLATRGPAAAAEHGSSYARSLEDDATAQLSTIRLARLAATFRGGPITTSTGEVVDVRVSDALPVETATPEGWAEFLVHLTHGSELGMLKASIVTFDEVQEICGARALGCYGRDQLVAPGETVVDTSPEEVVRHEYGHHIAAHRSNAPLEALDFGPKRWSSYELVCSNTIDGRLAPGDEGANYLSNPGEAWAEAYARLIYPTEAWRFTSLLKPTGGSLLAAQADVAQPWTQRTSQTFTGAGAKSFKLPLTLDGAFTVQLDKPGYRLVIKSGGKVMDRTNGKRIHYRIACRDRRTEQLPLTVVPRAGTTGKYALKVSYAG